MIEWRRQIKALLAYLWPKQSNRGPGSVQAGQVRGNITVNNHHHNYSSARKSVPFTKDHREVLELLSGLPERASVLDFMHREFGTRMVKELQRNELRRVTGYVLAIKQKTQKQPDAKAIP